MRPLRPLRRLTVPLTGLGLALAVACGGEPAAPPPADPLRAVSDFASIADAAARSQALFVEMGRVLQHPRCLNCHPSDMHPRQGEELAMHQPPVVRGDDGRGVAGARCATCHPAENVEHARLPGHPDWHLAPLEMGWIGVSLADLCAQLKDPERNGGMTLDDLHEHMAHDSLVGWGWSPGAGRRPAPGDQASFGRLTRAWIDSGAHCPEGEAGAGTGPAAPAGYACASCHDTHSG